MNSSILYPFCTLFASVNLFIFGAILLFRKNNSTVNHLLAAIILIPAAVFLTNYFMYSGLVIRYPSLFFLNFNSIEAVIIAWYVQLILGKTVVVNYKKLPHLIPLFLNTVYVVYLLFMGNTERNEILSAIATTNTFPWQMMALDIIVMFQILGYLIYSAVFIKRYEKENEVRISHAKVSWVKQLVYLLIILTLLVIIVGGTMPYEDSTYVYIPGIFLVFYFAIIYQAFSNSAVFSAGEFEKYISEEKENKKKYSNSALNELQIEDIYTRLLTFIQEEKPYRQAEISLKQLSDNLQLSQHLISQVINQKFEKSFPDLMNYYRVEEAKIMLKDQNNLNLSIEGIGLECGFNSPATFYRAFKKHAGSTPSQYIKIMMSDKE